MNEEVKRALFEKNARIIEAVKRRAELVCPGSLDMIAVTGSFASGDFHEKSDIDLLIVIGDDAGYALSHCFILGDVGYDLYCHTWERLEHAAVYDSPYVSKLLDAQIVYCREDAVRVRFEELAERLKCRLEEPLTAEDIVHAENFLGRAKQSYFDLASCGGERYHFHLIGVVYALECAVYLLNHAVVRHGVRGICKELSEMPHLPKNFDRIHADLFREHTYAQAMTLAMEMIRNTAQFIEQKRGAVCPKSAPCTDHLRGSYEELVSNYQNKLLLAVNDDNHYLSRMTLASAQLFFDEVGSAVDMKKTILIGSDAYETPESAFNAFVQALSQYEELYVSCDLPICRYDEISAFEEAYLSSENE